MQRVNKFPFLVLATFFMSLSVASASTVGFFAQNWSPFQVYPYTSNPLYQIYPGALDLIGQTAYFGSHDNFGYTNYLYALNVTNGQLEWRYNTTLPVNYVTHFTYNNSTYIIAGTGGSLSLPSQSHVQAFYQQKNITLWNSTNLSASVQDLGKAESNVQNTEDVIAGLANGQVFGLFGNNGSIHWRYNCAGNITAGNAPGIVQLDNGSVAVGTSNLSGQGYIYCFNKDGLPTWNYTSKKGNPLRIVTRFGSLNEVVAAFTDIINVRNGTNGAEIAPWPFNATQHIPPHNETQEITDLLCTQDYTGDRFPDIVVSTESEVGGFLTIINGKNATFSQGPTKVSSYALSYIQYMHTYENGIPILNKTLAVSIEDSSGSYYVYGVNASGLILMKEYPVPNDLPARNLIGIGNSTNLTGDLLFSAGDSVYCISNSEIVPEFPSQIGLVMLIVIVWFLVAILRRRRL
jgi:hypothetical protein